jgi:hypothetical protein
MTQGLLAVWFGAGAIIALVLSTTALGLIVANLAGVGS